MTEPEQILKSARRILIVDWPSRDVPDTLAGAGYCVLVKGGPGPEDYAELALRDGAVARQAVGRPREPIDVAYVHRPLEELAGIVALAKELGARTVWYQSGLASNALRDPKGCWLSDDASATARTLVEAAGLRYVDDVYIADAARQLSVET